MLIVIIAWVFFRADTIHDALNYIKAMFGFNKNDEELIVSSMYLENATYYVLMVIGIVGSTPLIKRYFLRNIDAFDTVYVNKATVLMQNIFIILLLVMVYIMLANNTYNPFIYFRF